MQNARAVILDLDNTLWDWYSTWYACFKAQLRELVRISGLEEAELLRHIRAVHQARRTIEYAFLIEDLPILKEIHGPHADVRVIYEPAIRAFAEVRRKVLHLYPGVYDTLVAIKARGTLIAAYTESNAFYTGFRLRRLQLDGILDVVYSPPDHEIPRSVDLATVRRDAPDAYGLRSTLHRILAAEEPKPNPNILLRILSDVGADPPSSVYVGDSLSKDVAMAQAAGVVDVYAKYGDTLSADVYHLLRSVSHWSDEQLAREERKRQSAPSQTPRYCLKESLAEMLPIIRFIEHS